MQFDEHLLRQAFYKCLHPPYLTNTGGNQRSDILKLAQCIEGFAPGILTIPTDDRGRPSFKLDRLAPANGYPHLNAHDALADVEATIYICRLIRDRAPHAWEQLLHCASKSRVLEVLETSRVFVLRDSYFSRYYEFALTRVGDELGGMGAILAYDLSVEPHQLIALGDEALASRLARTPKPLRRVRPNAAPFGTALPEGEAFSGMSYELLAGRAEVVQRDEEFRSRLSRLSVLEETAPSDHVEEQIYSGFPSPHDKALMVRFHAEPWCDRFAIVQRFEDPRYRVLGRRLIYAHCPESLPDEVRREEARLLACRLTGHSCDNPPWTTLAAADAEAQQMEEEGNPDHAAMLRGLRAHFASVLRRTAELLERLAK
jgi:exodeoxyribonuclease-1